MMTGLENVVNNHVRLKKKWVFFSVIEKTSERGTTLLFKYIKGSSREEANLLSSTSIE